jgi:hypothetical protein
MLSERTMGYAALTHPTLDLPHRKQTVAETPIVMAAQAANHVFFVGHAWKKKKVVDGGLRRHDEKDPKPPPA